MRKITRPLPFFFVECSHLRAKEPSSIRRLAACGIRTKNLRIGYLNCFVYCSEIIHFWSLHSVVFRIEINFVRYSNRFRNSIICRRRARDASCRILSSNLVFHLSTLWNTRFTVFLSLLRVIFIIFFVVKTIACDTYLVILFPHFAVTLLSFSFPP